MVQVTVQRDRAWRARIILYQLVLQAFASRPPGASRGAKVARTTYLCLGGVTWSIGCLCPNRHRPFAELARSSSYGCDAHFRHPRVMARFTTMAMETAYRCPNMAVDPPQTGLLPGPSADGRRPSAGDVKGSHSPRTTPAALPSHASCARTDCRLRLSRSCRPS